MASDVREPSPQRGPGAESLLRGSGEQPPEAETLLATKPQTFSL